jgi:hypothetical protein
MNDEVERMWKESVVAYFKSTTQHSPGGIEETMKDIRQDSQCPSHDSNQALPKFK